MTSENFNQILNNPLQLQLSQISMLNEVIKKNPYFQAPRAIQLKSLKEQGNYSYNQKLKEVAAYTVDRGVLFEFITSKAFLEKNTLVSKNEVLENQESSVEAIKMTNAEASQIVDPLLFEEKTAKKIITPPIEKSTPILDVNIPLNFQKEETHSFSEWLKLASLKPIVRQEENEVLSKKKMIESSLIDNFIKNSPKISPVKKDVSTVNLANQNMISTEDLMTETLAKVYIAQKNYKKAIQAYKILSLKNPEKSGLFADQIRAIEKLQNNK